MILKFISLFLIILGVSCSKEIDSNIQRQENIEKYKNKVLNQKVDTSKPEVRHLFSVKNYINPQDDGSINFWKYSEILIGNRMLGKLNIYYAKIRDVFTKNGDIMILVSGRGKGEKGKIWNLDYLYLINLNKMTSSVALPMPGSLEIKDERKSIINYYHGDCLNGDEQFLIEILKIPKINRKPILEYFILKNSQNFRKKIYTFNEESEINIDSNFKLEKVRERRVLSHCDTYVNSNEYVKNLYPNKVSIDTKDGHHVIIPD